MKNMILSFLIFSFIVSGCNEEGETPQLNTNSIYGTWKLVEFFTDSPLITDPLWNKIEDGFTVELRTNDTFTSGEYDGCPTGKFEIIENGITLTYDCAARSSMSYTFYLISSKLEWEAVCYEGCRWRFVKIADPQTGK